MSTNSVADFLLNLANLTASNEWLFGIMLMSILGGIFSFVGCVRKLVRFLCGLSDDVLEQIFNGEEDPVKEDIRKFEDVGRYLAKMPTKTAQDRIKKYVISSHAHAWLFSQWQKAGIAAKQTYDSMSEDEKMDAQHLYQDLFEEEDAYECTNKNR